MNILIIEESKTISQLIKKSLTAQGFNITLDDSKFNSRVYLKKNIFDAVVVNTNLPFNKTFTILEKIKKNDCKVKVLGVCSHGGWKDKVSFLKSGGDDVLSYPFPIQELVARIKSLERRPTSYVDDTLYIGEFLLDKDSLVASSDKGDVKLRKKEYDLLEYLIKNKDRTVSRCELHDHVWDYREYLGSNTVDVHIKRIREKLNKKDLIQTVHGQGYRVLDCKY